MVRRLFHRILSSLDDLSVRRKIVLSYVLGFVLPLILVSTATLLILTRQARVADERRADAIVRLVQDQMSASLDATIRLAGLLGTDDLVVTALDDWRIDRLGHLLRYRMQLRYYLDGFVIAYPQVQRIEFYTTNSAIIQGGSILYLSDEIRSTEWMAKLAAGDRRTVAVTFVDTALVEPRRTLSLVQRLGGRGEPGNTESHLVNETFLKIDVSLAFLRGIMVQAVPYGRVYLVDEYGRAVVGNSPDTGDLASLPEIGEVPVEDSGIRVTVPVSTGGPFSGLQVKGFFPYRSNRALSAYITAVSIGLAILGVLVASLIQFGIGFSLSRRLRVLTAKVEETRKDHFPAVEGVSGNDELGTLIRAYNRMTRTIDRLLEEVYEEGLMVNRLEVEKRHAELEALISKINPHFLSNSLNTIRMKCLSRNESDTADALKRLSRLFDYLTSWQDETILVRQEVDFITDFLSLQRYRFGEEYDFAVEVEPACLEMPIPRMLVQPLVENASKHGIEGRKRRGRIVVRFAVRDRRMVIEVSDNGNGMDREVLEAQRRRLSDRELHGESIGLQNVYNRLHLFYGEAAELRLESATGEGTQVVMAFPAAGGVESVESRSG